MKVLSFIALMVMVYMSLTLAVKIAEQVDITAGVCFAGITTTICILGSQWLADFLNRREAEAERLKRWRAISKSIIVGKDWFNE